MIFVASAISLLSYSASCSAFFESTATNIGFLFGGVLSKKAEQDAEYDNKLIADATKIIFDLIS